MKKLSQYEFLPQYSSMQASSQIDSVMLSVWQKSGLSTEDFFKRYSTEQIYEMITMTAPRFGRLLGKEKIIDLISNSKGGMEANISKLVLNKFRSLLDAMLNNMLHNRVDLTTEEARESLERNEEYNNIVQMLYKTYGQFDSKEKTDQWIKDHIAIHLGRAEQELMQSRYFGFPSRDPTAISITLQEIFGEEIPEKIVYESWQGLKEYELSKWKKVAYVKKDRIYFLLLPGNKYIGFNINKLHNVNTNTVTQTIESSVQIRIDGIKERLENNEKVTVPELKNIYRAASKVGKASQVVEILKSHPTNVRCLTALFRAYEGKEVFTRYFLDKDDPNFNVPTPEPEAGEMDQIELGILRYADNIGTMYQFFCNQAINYYIAKDRKAVQSLIQKMNTRIEEAEDIGENVELWTEESLLKSVWRLPRVRFNYPQLFKDMLKTVIEENGGVYEDPDTIVEDEYTVDEDLPDIEPYEEEEEEVLGGNIEEIDDEGNLGLRKSYEKIGPEFKQKFKDTGLYKKKKKFFPHIIETTNKRVPGYTWNTHGANWMETIYVHESIDVPDILFKAMDLHSIGSGVFKKPLGWIGGTITEYLQDEKKIRVAFVTESQCDLLQRSKMYQFYEDWDTFYESITDEMAQEKGFKDAKEYRIHECTPREWFEKNMKLQNPDITQEELNAIRKMKSKIENLFKSWPIVFMNAAIRRAIKEDCTYLCVVSADLITLDWITLDLNKEEDWSNVYYRTYDKVAQLYTNKRSGQWWVIDLNTDVLGKFARNMYWKHLYRTSGLSFR